MEAETKKKHPLLIIISNKSIIKPLFICPELIIKTLPHGYGSSQNIPTSFTGLE